MAELENKKEVTAKRAASKRLKTRVIGSLDTSVEDVLKCVQEGRDIIFKDGDEFLELPTEVYKQLLPIHKTRYQTAKSITEGVDVIGIAAESKFDLKLNYNKRHMDVGDQLRVHGKKADRDYYWERADRVHSKQIDGWEVDKDRDVKTIVDDGKIKYIGGEKAPEMVLMSIPKTVLKEKKELKRARKEFILTNQKDAFKDTIERLGSKFVAE